jgi:ferredoxin-NADP reductase
MTEATRALDLPVTQWRRGLVRDIHRMSATLVSIRLEIPDRIQQVPGQHYVVRLTAEDGYTASRSYSIASAPHDELVELCVERLPDGEVSGFLYDEARVGDELEIRGPIGGWFVWDGTKPAIAVGGGSGVVPLVAMLRHAVHVGAADLLTLAASGRSRGQLPYADELAEFGATIALTGSDVPGTVHHRLTATDLAPLVTPEQTAYVCGSTRFAEAISMALMEAGVADRRIKVERFGPT